MLVDTSLSRQLEHLAEATALLDDFPAIVAFSGKLLKDGDVSREAARELIRTWQDQEHSRGRLFVDKRFPQLHGCNLVMRRTLLTRETFDEALPAYSLGEDYDLWVRINRYGFT